MGFIYNDAMLKKAGISAPPGHPVMATRPGLALALGFIPGVGAIYNGQFMKAIVQVLIFGSIIGLSDRMPGPMDAIFGMGAAAFYFYMVIDSYRTMSLFSAARLLVLPEVNAFVSAKELMKWAWSPSAERRAPAESMSHTIGTRSRSASSRSRATLRSPTGPMLPPCTVKS